MKYTFSNGVKDFKLTIQDHKCIEQGHMTSMRTWEQPMSMNALSGVDWDRVLKSFPFHTFYCKDCSKGGSDYEINGEPRT